MLSGYLVYPVYKIDLFDVAWKIPLDNNTIYKFENIMDDYDWIKSWARIPAKPKSEVLMISTKEWIKIWSQNLTPMYNSILVLLLFSAFILPFVIKKTNISDYVFLLTILFWFVFWFFNAPDLRFGFSFLIFIVLFFISYIVIEINKIHDLRATYLALYFVLLYHILVPNITVREIVSCFTSYFRKPERYKNTEYYSLKIDNNLTIITQKQEIDVLEILFHVHISETIKLL